MFCYWYVLKHIPFLDQIKTKKTKNPLINAKYMCFCVFKHAGNKICENDKNRDKIMKNEHKNGKEKIIIAGK